MKNKLYKILGAVLSVAVVLTAVFCLPAVAENTTDEVIVKDYYVMSTGFNGNGTSGDGRSEDAPAPTVADVIASINEDNLDENDIANVYIMQRTSYVDKTTGETVTTAYNTWDTSNAQTNNGYYKHNMTAWTDYNAAPAEWKCKVVIKSPEGSTNYLAYSQYYGLGANLYISGPVIFENVIITCMNNNTQNPIVTNDYDVVFSESTKFTSINKNGKATEWSLYDGNTNNRWVPISLTETGAEYSKPINLTINSKYLLKTASTQRLERIGLMLASYDAKTTVFNEDVNIVIDNSETAMQFTFGGNNTSSNATFNKTLNINVKNAVSLTVNNAGSKNDGKTGSIAVTEGLQIIYPSTATTSLRTARTTVADDEVSGTSLVNEFKTKGVTNYWVIKRVSDNENIIDFAKDQNGDVVAGTFNIEEGYIATATDAEGNTYTSKNGVLDLSQVPGSYTVTFERGQILKDYYVQSPGVSVLSAEGYAESTDRGAGTKENPAHTVEDLINIIGNSLTAIDTANVYIMQRDDYLEYDGSDITSSNKPYSNITAWSDDGTVPTHAYKIVLKSEGDTNNYLAVNYKVGQANDFVLGGPTVFENVVITQSSNSHKPIVSNGYDITTSANTTFGYINIAPSANAAWTKGIASTGGFGIWTVNSKRNNDSNSALGPVTDIVNITINSPYAPNSAYGARRILFGFGSGSVSLHENDLNVTIDNAEAEAPIHWGNHTGYGANANGPEFEKSVNIKIKDAKKVSNTNTDSTEVIVEGAIQVIAPATLGFDMTNVKGVIADFDSKYYLLENATDNKELLDFVKGTDGNAIVGQYIVAKGVDVVATNKSTGEVVKSADGILNLTDKPGEYVVNIKETETHNYDSYINYRNGLGNTYSKLTKDKALNVVYFGGSVTSGSGSSNAELYSWRGLVGNWITNNFPAANVTNIKQSIGETGTYLGCYRVARDVVSKAPDLLFIEYSINDYYDHASYDRAQMQFETIVREVKTKYPNCDIVTILVTDYGNISTARANKLHTQAQAHEDICVEYNIPSIYVGNALAAALGEDWTKQEDYKDDAVWMQYVKDIVHPLDAGYEIYFNVIKEFLNNELNYGEYDGTVKTNPMPEIQNNYKYLFDGEVTYIDESTVEFTTEGGTTYNPDSEGIVSKEDYQGLIFVPAGSTDTVTVNFSGTELIMVTTGGHDKTVEITTTDSAYTEENDIDSETDGIQIKVVNTYEVSLDGGATWETRQYEGKNPILIASGLEDGEHTAIIRPSSYTQVRIAGFYSRNVEKSSNILNIADLVNADEQIAASTTTAYYDYNNDDVIDTKDVATVKKILLNK